MYSLTMENESMYKSIQKRCLLDKNVAAIDFGASKKFLRIFLSCYRRILLTKTNNE